MERWVNKVAVVTGASSGIGAAVVKDLIKVGFIVVGLARRVDLINEIRNGLPEEQRSRLHAIKCDVTIEEDVKNSFNWIEQNLGGTDVLINNAGITRSGICLITPANTGSMKEILDTNVTGVLYCTREAFNSMKKRNFDGHVVVVNSIAGHRVVNFMTKNINCTTSSTNMYCPSKFAVTAMVETYRQEFIISGTKVKITSISPGLVDTDIVPQRLRARNMPLLRPEDISDAILYIIGTPPNVQIHELIIKPVGEQF